MQPLADSRVAVAREVKWNKSLPGTEGIIQGETGSSRLRVQEQEKVVRVFELNTQERGEWVQAVWKSSDQVMEQLTIV